MHVHIIHASAVRLRAGRRDAKGDLPTQHPLDDLERQKREVEREWQPEACRDLPDETDGAEGVAYRLPNLGAERLGRAKLAARRDGIAFTIGVLSRSMCFLDRRAFRSGRAGIRGSIGAARAGVA